jgi:bacterioferritin (cytochrome b1)
MDKIAEMLNVALEMEYGAYIQYLTHAELFKGESYEALSARFKVRNMPSFRG